MSVSQLYKKLKKQKQLAGKARRKQAECDFQKAAEIAEQAGMKLIKRSSQHYQLKSINPAWLLDIYPGNQRLYTPQPAKHAVKPPYLGIWNWTLIDVVETAVKKK